MAWSKDLPALRDRLRRRIQEAVAAAAPVEERTGLRSWTIGDLPRSVETHHAGLVVTAYPALVDDGESVARRVLPTEAEQALAMWAGTRRLLLLQLGSPLRTLDRSLAEPDQAGHRRLRARHRVRGVPAMRRPPPWTSSCSRPADPCGPKRSSWPSPRWCERRFGSTVTAVAEVVGDIVATVSRVEDRLSKMVAASLDETVLDVQEHLRRLVHRGWITTAGADRLPDVLRYARGLEHRVEKAAGAPDRDRARIAGLRALERDYRRVATADVDGRVRWMLEELRVSTFAQKVGVKGGASEQKVRAELIRLGG